MGSSARTFLLSVLFLNLSLSSLLVEAQLSPLYYLTTCPLADLRVRLVVRKALIQDYRLGAGLLRLFFHDCFVNGCDGSILEDSVTPGNGEKDALPNLTLHGFEIIDAAKAAVEAACPGVVSCADIAAIAARESVAGLGFGLWSTLPLGRRDGPPSSKAAVTGNIPSPFDDASKIVSLFQSKGLTQDQMVILSGSHTIGKAHCFAFANRLYNFSSPSGTDPTLDPAYAAQLKTLCPFGASNPNTLVPMDPVTQNVFDAQYFRNLVQNKGLFTSDQTLYSGATQSLVVSEASPFNPFFRARFIAALEQLSRVGVITAPNGNIRTNCRIAH